MRAIMFAALLPLAACGNGDDGRSNTGVAGTGSGDLRTYAVADFTGVSLRGPDDVDVRVGAGFSVRAEGEPDVIAKLKIEKVGQSLRIGRIKSSGLNWNSGPGAKIYVTMPRLTDAGLAGSGDLTVDRAEGSQFAGSLAGSGTLSVGTIAAETVVLSIAGSGNIRAGGTARSLKVDIAGSGDVDAAKLVASSASVSIAGSGSVRASVDGQAKVSIMGSGDVDLGAKARCQTSKMGSGEVRCG